MDINNKDYDDHDGNDSSQISKKSIGTIVYVTNIPFVLTMAGLMELFELNGITTTVITFNIYIIRQTYL